MVNDVASAAVHDDVEDAIAVLSWRWAAPVEALSSASVGGGRRRIGWALNIGVAFDYARTDLDHHVAETARRLGLRGPGVGLLTAADVTTVRRARDDVVVDSTVGVTKPTWAAGDDHWSETAGSEKAARPGTINTVIQLPVPLDEGAAVNAVITATEAKTQALVEHGVPGTGTASDAVLVVWPDPELAGRPPERFGGPRSHWGARIARAVHATIDEALRATTLPGDLR